MTREGKIAVIREYVPKLRAQIAGLTADQLTTQYNPPEWTVAQNVHHQFDSHVNSYVRFKLILTEENATIRPYDQDEFAKLADASDANIKDSLLILEGLHTRWARMLDTIRDWSKAGFHPELNQTLSLNDLLDICIEHCHAHTQQIQEVLDKI